MENTNTGQTNPAPATSQQQQTETQEEVAEFKTVDELYAAYRGEVARSDEEKKKRKELEKLVKSMTNTSQAFPDSTASTSSSTYTINGQQVAVSHPTLLSLVEKQTKHAAARTILAAELKNSDDGARFNETVIKLVQDKALSLEEAAKITFRVGKMGKADTIRWLNGEPNTQDVPAMYNLQVRPFRPRGGRPRLSRRKAA